jgi:GTPase SAR1 family protein
LDLAKQALLAEYNVQWLPLRAEEFVRRFLGQLTASRDRGLTFLASKADRKRPASQELPEVATLAAVPLSQTEYLLGHEPIWADIQTGRAIERVCDVSLLETTKRILSTVGKPKGILIVTGTAGSGKTTALMRLCLDLVREGYAVGWNDRDSELSPRNIRGAMIANEAPRVLAIDDADLFGSELAPMLRDIALADTFPLCIVGIRAGRLERALNPVLLKAIPVREETMPHLEDRDIRRLIGVLDRENRLGILKGKSSDEQYRLLSQQAGRQLLVAMIQATSGEKFEDKVVNELDELETEAQLIYAIIAVASSFRYALAREEIVLACKKHPSNIVLNLLEQLSRRHLVSSADGLYRARHRVIADLLVSELTKLGRLAEVIYGLALVAATKCGPGSARSTKAARFLRMLINHDFLSRTVGIEPARNFYGKLEDILSWDSHYWLQRGSLEVESGSISLAENFLNQAKGLAPDDVLVQNEFAYLQFRKAIENPLRVDAKDLVEQAVRTLETLIALRGNFDSYPFHVLGSQGLSWSRRGIVDKQQRISFLQQLLRTVENGCGRHPYQKDLSELRDDLKRELLGQAVR